MRPPCKEEDWVRFLENGRRTRRLRIDDRLIGDDFFLALAAYRPIIALLLPNLREVSWVSDSTDYRGPSPLPFPMLLGPHITGFRVELKDGVLSPVLCEILPHVCPNLQSFTVAGIERRWYNVGDAFHQAIISFKSLTALNVEASITSHTFLQLGARSQLQELGLVLSTSDLSAINEIQSEAFFPSLRKFKVHVQYNAPSQFFVNFLRSITTKDLEEVDYTLQSIANPAYADTFNALTAHKSLQRVTLNLHNRRERSEIQFSTLAPLFELDGLRELHSDMDVILSKKSLLDVGSVWPHLEVLSLWPGSIRRILAFTLNDLPFVLTKWPRLQELAIPFDATVRPRMGELASPAPALTSLRTSLCPIKKDKTGEIAAFLAELCPNVRVHCASEAELISGGVDTGTRLRNLSWEIVAQMTPVLNMVRERAMHGGLYE